MTPPEFVCRHCDNRITAGRGVCDECLDAMEALKERERDMQACTESDPCPVCAGQVPGLDGHDPGTDIFDGRATGYRSVAVDRMRFEQDHGFRCRSCFARVAVLGDVCSSCAADEQACTAAMPCSFCDGHCAPEDAWLPATKDLGPPLFEVVGELVAEDPGASVGYVISPSSEDVLLIDDEAPF